LEIHVYIQRLSCFKESLFNYSQSGYSITLGLDITKNCKRKGNMSIRMKSIKSICLFVLFTSLQSQSIAFSQNTNHLNLGISYNQVVSYLEEQMPMFRGTDIQGQANYVGQTIDNLALLQIIGNKENISQASIMIGIPNDSQIILLRNTAMMMRFLKNTVPEWEGAFEWCTDALVEAYKQEKEIKIIKGQKLISVLNNSGLGLITIKHKDSN
jgi:hypothetical protein